MPEVKGVIERVEFPSGREFFYIKEISDPGLTPQAGLLIVNDYRHAQLWQLIKNCAYEAGTQPAPPVLIRYEERPTLNGVVIETIQHLPLNS